MPLRGPLRQMRKQNYAEGGCWVGGWGDNRGRRDFDAFRIQSLSSSTRRKREQIIKKWSKCTGRWAAGGMPRLARGSHDWYRHQCSPERLLMKPLPRIGLLPDSVLYSFLFFFQTLLSEHDERTPTRWWQPWRLFWGILHLPQLFI